MHRLSVQRKLQRSLQRLFRLLRCIPKMIFSYVCECGAPTRSVAFALK